MQGYQTNGFVSSVNEETALPGTEDLLVYQLLERQIFRNNGAMRTHGLRNTMARQQTPKRRLLYLDRSRVVEEPADERNPKPPTKIAVEHLPDTGKDEQEGKKPTDVCCDEGRPAHVSCDRPGCHRGHRPDVRRTAWTHAVALVADACGIYFMAWCLVSGLERPREGRVAMHLRTTGRTDPA